LAALRTLSTLRRAAKASCRGQRLSSNVRHHVGSAVVDQKQSAVVAELIARYLDLNPHAADTAEGIARWWLAETSVTTRVVQRALDELLDHGRIAASPGLDGRLVYSLPMRSCSEK